MCSYVLCAICTGNSSHTPRLLGTGHNQRFGYRHGVLIRSFRLPLTEEQIHSLLERRQRRTELGLHLGQHARRKPSTLHIRTLTVTVVGSQPVPATGFVSSPETTHRRAVPNSSQRREFARTEFEILSQEQALFAQNSHTTLLHNVYPQRQSLSHTALP